MQIAVYYLLSNEEKCETYFFVAYKYYFKAAKLFYYNQQVYNVF